MSKIDPQFVSVGYAGFQDGLCEASIHLGKTEWGAPVELHGLIDRTGEWVILPEYDYIIWRSEGRAVVHKDGKVGVVDMAGNGNTLAAVHNHYDAQLKYSCLVGATHWNARSGAKGMAGPKPELFFAPSHIEQRTKDWGPAGLQERLGDSWAAFRDSSDAWLRVKRAYGRAAVEQVFNQTLDAQTQPADGHVISLWDSEGEAAGQ